LDRTGLFLHFNTKFIPYPSDSERWRWSVSFIDYPSDSERWKWSPASL